MRTALRRRNQINVAFADRLFDILRPDERPVDFLMLRTQGTGEWLLRDMLGVSECFDQILFEAAGILPGLRLFRFLDIEAYFEPRAKDRFCTQQMAQARDREIRRVEILRIRPEANRRAGVRLAYLADDGQFAFTLTAGKAHVVFLRPAPDPDFEVFRQGVDDRHADAVQTAGILVLLVGEFAARVEPGQNQLDTWHLFFGMNIDGHPATVIGNFERAVPIERDVDLLRMSGNSLIDAVINDFVREMIWPGSVGIHARSTANRIETAQDLNVGRTITFAHSDLLKIGDQRGANVI